MPADDGAARRLRLLQSLATDAFWSWSHSADALWRALDRDTWERTRNPWIIVRDASERELAERTAEPAVAALLQAAAQERHGYYQRTPWFATREDSPALGTVAYFCMEFGLGAALPLYAGGLGVLAGDYLKAASDLGVPAIGVGLLYQRGYTRQLIGHDGWQHDVYAFNDPSDLPLRPARLADGRWAKVTLALPGRSVAVRVWSVVVGRCRLYLLDTNDPRNSAVDRGITAELYPADAELRLLQAMVLGVGGWRALRLLGIEPRVCHLNESHSALVVLERARWAMERQHIGFDAALWATRAGNLFTTHTPVDAGFERFEERLVRQYLIDGHEGYARALQLDGPRVMALGRPPGAAAGPFDMACLAIRGSAFCNGVSSQHRQVSRRLFQPLFPRWPRHEVPVDGVTNGVHVPTWDSAQADALWTELAGKGRWLGSLEALQAAVRACPPARLWALRVQQRTAFVHRVRERLVRQVLQRTGSEQEAEVAALALDPNVLTVGLARRFTAYKRPNLLLHDRERLRRLLLRSDCGVQLVVAGKAHPADVDGKRLVQEWVRFTDDPEIRTRAVFLEDYDMSLAAELVAGCDLWLNVPLPPWEACGTSGMKVLVNGGLNLSTLEGWWAEAWRPGVGWALPSRQGAGSDEADAHALYQLLEEEVVPLFYARGPDGVPVGWVARMTESMAELAAAYSANRMLREYVERIYLDAARLASRRESADAGLELSRWARLLEGHWHEIHFGPQRTDAIEGGWCFMVPVYLGDAVTPELVQVEAYADPADGDEGPLRTPMRCVQALSDAGGFVYRAEVRSARPACDFTPRVIPAHPLARVPTELPLIRWYR